MCQNLDTMKKLFRDYQKLDKPKSVQELFTIDGKLELKKLGDTANRYKVVTALKKQIISVPALAKPPSKDQDLEARKGRTKVKSAGGEEKEIGNGESVGQRETYSPGRCP